MGRLPDSVRLGRLVPSARRTRAISTTFSEYFIRVLGYDPRVARTAITCLRGRGGDSRPRLSTTWASLGCPGSARHDAGEDGAVVVIIASLSSRAAETGGIYPAIRRVVSQSPSSDGWSRSLGSTTAGPIELAAVRSGSGENLRECDRRNLIIIAYLLANVASSRPRGRNPHSTLVAADVADSRRSCRVASSGCRDISPLAHSWLRVTGFRVLSRWPPMAPFKRLPSSTRVQTPSFAIALEAGSGLWFVLWARSSS